MAAAAALLNQLAQDSDQLSQTAKQELAGALLNASKAVSSGFVRYSASASFAAASRIASRWDPREAIAELRRGYVVRGWCAETARIATITPIGKNLEAL